MRSICRQSWIVAQSNRLMEMAWGPNGGVGVSLSDVECKGGDDGKRVRVGKVKKMRLNYGVLDIAFAGSPNHCDPETCKELEELFDWRRTMSVRNLPSSLLFLRPRLTCLFASQFKRLMTANVLTSKSTIYPEWFTDGLAPWVQYVPIQNTYSDLYDALVFFRSDLAGRGAHEELVAKIARGGME
ncbi:hypothetical protein K503DRAFT_854285 [Rhizopogon vinicolor AM-OR11-026]|uniref:Glycosyl transferase CAP10 domain-containing protein n=1 Tax=Rhizopogon vinicolor AM-OR11-026 TaxID=1314800 RepID=A0A1B7NB21_9AGAM|nr:hypothetical protein K503DRAFT_854285 [Rhizopogon vinicolor AM-OR11-026]